MDGLKGARPMTVALRPLIKPDERISRIRLSESGSIAPFASATIDRVGDFSSWRLISLRSHPPRPLLPPRQSIPSSLRSHYRSFVATTQDSDFCADSRRLTGHARLARRVDVFLPHHRHRPPRFMCGLPSRRACHADPAGVDSAPRFAALPASAFIHVTRIRRLPL